MSPSHYQPSQAQCREYTYTLLLEFIYTTKALLEGTGDAFTHTQVCTHAVREGSGFRAGEQISAHLGKAEFEFSATHLIGGTPAARVGG